MSKDDNAELKYIAVEFLQLIIAGEINAAYTRHVDMMGKHHNPFYASGFSALKRGMSENQVEFPNKQMAIQHILGDGDLVTIHSHIVPRPGDPGIAAVHIFRFRGDKIVELWDLGQPVPPQSPNTDGMF